MMSLIFSLINLLMIRRDLSMTTEHGAISHVTHPETWASLRTGNCFSKKKKKI